MPASVGLPPGGGALRGEQGRPLAATAPAAAAAPSGRGGFAAGPAAQPVAAQPESAGSPSGAGSSASDAAALLEAARATVLGPLPSPRPGDAPSEPGRRVTVFASLALGPEGLRELFAAAAATPDTRVVFRGLPPGVGLRAFLATVHALLEGLDPVPAVVIDPQRFRAAAVTVVPEIVVTLDGVEQARVRGLVDPRWLLAEVAAGRRGDRGAYGPTVAVAEADLLEVLLARVAAWDGEALRDRALERFWGHVSFVELPETTVPRERRVDPTVVATADLRGPDGTVLVQAGEAVNPLARLPFTRRLVVFDATRPAQVEAARRLAAEESARVVLLASALDRARGWDGLAALEATLGAPVYLLTPEVRARFALERVPAVVSAEAGAFVVREVVP